MLGSVSLSVAEVVGTAPPPGVVITKGPVRVVVEPVVTVGEFGPLVGVTVVTQPACLVRLSPSARVLGLVVVRPSRPGLRCTPAPWGVFTFVHSECGRQVSGKEGPQRDDGPRRYRPERSGPRKRDHSVPGTQYQAPNRQYQTGTDHKLVAQEGERHKMSCGVEQTYTHVTRQVCIIPFATLQTTTGNS